MADAGVARANKRPFWSKAGETPAPAVPSKSVGAPTMGDESVLNPHNNDRGSRIPDRQPTKTQFHRGATTAESNGPRLSISMSSKLPTNDEPSGMNHRPKIVSSRGTGSKSLFDSSMYSTQGL